MKTSIQKLNITESPSLECVRKWPSKRARKWSEEFVWSAAKQSNIKAIIVLGSAIRNVSKIADIDFIIIYSNIKPKLNSPPIDVDIRAYDKSIVAKLLSEGHELLGWAVKLGCVVYERNRYWTNLRSNWVDRLKFPSMDDAMARAAKAENLYHDLSAMGDKDAANEQFITMLTHLARARLLGAGVFPTSRPELVRQLREISENELADKLAEALKQ